MPKFSILENVRGAIPVGLLLFVAIIVASAWFMMGRSVGMPSLSEGIKGVPVQKLPPASGVVFSSEPLSPEKQAQRYYKDQRGAGR